MSGPGYGPTLLKLLVFVALTSFQWYKMYCPSKIKKKKVYCPNHRYIVSLLMIDDGVEGLHMIQGRI